MEISCIIPVRNGKEFLKFAFDSILQQTFKQKLEVKKVKLKFFLDLRF